VQLELKKYSLETSSSFLNYEFISKGPKGHIRKKIVFKEVDGSGVFNLGFGDVDEITGEIDDFVVTNNRDTLVVMSTVAAAVVQFLEKYPDKYVFAIGSTPARSRLYNIGIAKYLQEITIDFHVFGYIENEWRPFKPAIRYQAFLIRKK
jgi:hypothetical protein